MWIQHGDAKPQLIAPTYATVTRTGSITAPKRMETDAKYVVILFLADPNSEHVMVKFSVQKKEPSPQNSNRISYQSLLFCLPHDSNMIINVSQ